MECVQAVCSIDQLSVRELIDDADDSLFSQLMNNEIMRTMYCIICCLRDVTLAMTCDLDTISHRNLIVS